MLTFHTERILGCEKRVEIEEEHITLFSNSFKPFSQFFFEPLFSSGSSGKVNPVFRRVSKKQSEPEREKEKK